VVIFSVLAILAFVYLILLVARLVLDWVQVFARDWRPRGVVLVLAEAVYTVTDPPLRLLRRVIPPLRLGNVRLDLAFTVLFVVVWVLLSFFTVLGS
jgi:YggT family protein